MDVLGGHRLRQAGGQAHSFLVNCGVPREWIETENMIEVTKSSSTVFIGAYPVLMTVYWKDGSHVTSEYKGADLNSALSPAHVNHFRVSIIRYQIADSVIALYLKHLSLSLQSLDVSIAWLVPNSSQRGRELQAEMLARAYAGQERRACKQCSN